MQKTLLLGLGVVFAGCAAGGCATRMEQQRASIELHTVELTPAAGELAMDARYIPPMLESEPAGFTLTAGVQVLGE